MRIDDTGREIVGVYDPEEKRTFVRRDQLKDRAKYAGVLLHELTHALTNTRNVSLEFEEALTENLGKLAILAASSRLGLAYLLGKRR